MENVKIVYFDINTIDVASMEKTLSSICSSIFVIKAGIVLVSFLGTPKDLFNQLQATSLGHNLLIIEVDSSSGGYWGFMNNNLWKWLSE